MFGQDEFTQCGWQEEGFLGSCTRVCGRAWACADAVCTDVESPGVCADEVCRHERTPSAAVGQREAMRREEGQ